MFLIRSLKEDDARRLEQYLKGDKNVTLGYEHSDYIPSAESENRIFSSPAEKVVYEKNIESLKEVGSYFFHSKDDLVGFDSFFIIYLFAFLLISYSSCSIYFICALFNELSLLTNTIHSFQKSLFLLCCDNLL